MKNKEVYDMLCDIRRKVYDVHSNVCNEKGCGGCILESEEGCYLFDLADNITEYIDNTYNKMYLNRRKK